MFVGARILTELINFILMWLLIDKIGINQLVSKIVPSIVVIVLNYILGKFVIFRKNINVKENK